MKQIIFGLFFAVLSPLAFAQNQTVKCSSDQFPQNTGSDIFLQLYKNKLTGFVTLNLHGETDPIKKSWVSYNTGKTQFLQNGKSVNYLKWAAGWPGSPRYAALYNFFYDGVNPLKTVQLGVSVRNYSGDIWYNNETIYTYKCN